jgi:hypothetical protein
LLSIQYYTVFTHCLRTVFINYPALFIILLYHYCSPARGLFLLLFLWLFFSSPPNFRKKGKRKKEKAF